VKFSAIWSRAVAVLFSIIGEVNIYKYNLFRNSNMIEFENYSEPKYDINPGKGVIIGRTEIMLDLFRYINHLANLPTTVLLRGETGTGKELCAKALHYNGGSQRKGNHFVAVNCAGIPSELLESELFGYVKGSFTGAYKDTQGKFQHAHCGTILLDEIGDMSPKLQTKVLRVLQERQVTRVGSNIPEEVNVRVVAATNKNLEEEVNKGNFREDLYYRLNVVPVRVPALSERKDDIPLIAEYFIKKYNGLYGVKIDGLSGSAKEKLKWAEWKGNVRELENVVERVFVLRKSGMIEADDLYFNSDMPKRILVQQHEISERGTEPKKEPIKETEKLWYQEGVLPISPRMIAEVQGSRSYPTIMKVAGGGEVYSIRMGSGKQRSSPLIYLTPESVKLFFKDTSTENYRKLEARIRDDKFNKIAEKPFAFLSISDLIANPNTIKSASTIKREAAKSGAYKVSVGFSSCFAINLSNAHYFISRGCSRIEQRTAKLQETINKSYEQFRSWNPK
jgi:transcriptional regulator with AAA-type ATPase domain